MSRLQALVPLLLSPQNTLLGGIPFYIPLDANVFPSPTTPPATSTSISHVPRVSLQRSPPPLLPESSDLYDADADGLGLWDEWVCRGDAAAFENSISGTQVAARQRQDDGSMLPGLEVYAYCDVWIRDTCSTCIRSGQVYRCTRNAACTRPRIVDLCLRHRNSELCSDRVMPQSILQVFVLRVVLCTG